MSVILEFSMFPTDKGESKSPYVSQVVKMIRESGVDYKLTPMSTVIETETLAEALAMVEKAYAILESMDCNRVYSALKMDIRRGSEKRFGQKIKSVEDKIGQVSS
jgi:uncharacterized protein (TIGR00106 family)